jgi:hypothetical protein
MGETLPYRKYPMGAAGFEPARFPGDPNAAVEGLIE